MINPARLIPLRHRFVRTIRDWFSHHGFSEVETPICVRSPGMEPHLDAFEVKSAETLPPRDSLYLHTSPEYHMKRILANHQKPIFQLCRCFRDEPPSRLHHPEFTMLEWYRTHADYRSLMVDCEQLLASLADEFLDGSPLNLEEGAFSLTVPFERLTVGDAFVTWAGLDPLQLDDRLEFVGAAQRAGFDVPDHWQWEDVFHFILLEAVEPHLGMTRPTILFEYPTRLAALSRIVDGVAERFELYIGRHELANAFSELVNPEEQRQRFVQDQQLRRSLNRPIYPIDEALLEALEKLPPSAGIALGVDRLWLLFCEHILGQRLNLTEVLFLTL